MKRTVHQTAFLQRLTLIVVACLLVSASPTFGQGGQLPPVDPPKSASFPKIVSRTLKNRLRVFVVEDHSAPVVSMQLVIDAGAGVPGVTPGLAAFTAGLLDQGTASRSASAIAESIDFVGGSLDTDAGHEAAEIECSVVSAHTKLAFDLVSDVARNPAFVQEEIDRRREQSLADLQVNYGTPGYVADTAFRRLVLGGSAALPLDGTPDTVKTFTREQIVKFHQANYVPNRAFLVVGGDIAAADAFAEAERVFGDWKPGKSVASGKPTSTVEKSKPRFVVIDKPGAAQTEVRVGHACITRRDPEYFAGTVMNAVLGDGYSSRLNKEIRINRGLSYGARSALVTGRTTGYFSTRCGTKAASTREVVDVFLGEMKRIRDEAIPAEEFAVRRTTVTGEFVMGLQSVRSVVGAVADTVLYGLDVSTLNSYMDQVNAVTAARARQFAVRRLNVKTPVIVLVGDAGVFGEDLKKHYGEFTTIKLSEFNPLKPGLK